MLRSNNTFDPSIIWRNRGVSRLTKATSADNEIPAKIPLSGGYSIDPGHADPRACASSCLRRLFDANPGPRPGWVSVAGKGNAGAVARTAVAAPTKEHAQKFANPFAHLQGRIGT